MYSETKGADDTRDALEDWLPAKYWADIPMLLGGFGQVICLPRGPHCWECPVKNLCEYKEKNLKKPPEKSIKIKSNKKAVGK